MENSNSTTVVNVKSAFAFLWLFSPSEIPTKVAVPVENKIAIEKIPLMKGRTTLIAESVCSPTNLATKNPSTMV